jgi:predicted HTH transcriptional regulator
VGASRYFLYGEKMEEVVFSTGLYLSSSARFKLFSRLEQKILMVVIDNQPCTNVEIARRCWTSHQSISSTLRRLKKEEVVSSYKEGRNSYWAISNLNIYKYLQVLNSRHK